LTGALLDTSLNDKYEIELFSCHCQRATGYPQVKLSKPQKTALLFGANIYTFPQQLLKPLLKRLSYAPATWVAGAEKS
jgi:hypothetical protein